MKRDLNDIFDKLSEEKQNRLEEKATEYITINMENYIYQLLFTDYPDTEDLIKLLDLDDDFFE